MGKKGTVFLLGKKGAFLRKIPEWLSTLRRMDVWDEIVSFQGGTKRESMLKINEILI